MSTLGNRCLATLFLLPALSAQAAPYLGASIGDSVAHLSQRSPTIDYFSGTTITDAYPLNKTHNSQASFSVNGGWASPLPAWHSLLALGVGVYSNFSNYRFNGHLVETAEGDAPSTLYRYQAKLTSTRVLAEAQWTWLAGRLAPFAQLGVGVAMNRMKNYGESVVTPNGYVPLPPFQDHSNAQFAYQIGAGISSRCHLFSSQAAGNLSLGYRYANSGKPSFGIRNADYPYALKMGTLSTNEVYLAYTHYFKEVSHEK